MNELFAALILAIVQGITEWLPISSSGHLIIFHELLQYKTSLTFDVALHFGTLMAVFVYFGKDIVEIIQDVCSFRFKTEHGQLGVLLLIASIPAAVIGYVFLDFFSRIYSSLSVVAWGFGITGLFLIISSFELKLWGKRFGWKQALFVGCAQVLSILPGISRSGMTLGSGILFGLTPKAAGRFSFLMAIPIIFGANIAVIGNEPLQPSLIWASLVSFAVGLTMLHVLYRFVLTSRRNLRWFGLYALALAAGILTYLVFL